MRASHFSWASVVAAVVLLLSTRAYAGAPGVDEDEDENGNDEPASASAPPAREALRGSGGIAISAVRGTRNGRGDTPITGVHVTAAWRFGHTRLGATMALQHDTDLLLPNRYAQEVRGAGTSGRLGGIIGWGAPWNDTVIGFLGEAGVTAGTAGGSSAPRSVPDCRPCGGPGRTITTTYASPYGGAWLMLQFRGAFPCVRSLASACSGPRTSPIPHRCRSSARWASFWKAW